LSAAAVASRRPQIALTVLGSSCSIPRPGRACSSYLIEAGGATLVADLGSGSFANLVRYRRPEALDGILISHMHADHFLDLIPLRYAMKYGERTSARKVPLYLPPGGERTLRQLCSAFAKESGDDFLGDVFELLTYDPAAVLRFKAAAITFAAAHHFVPTYAIRCDVEGRSIAYSSDTAPSPAVSALAAGADVFLCEATLREDEEFEPPRGHSSAREAGAMAAQAAAGSLLLTHYPATADPSALARGAAGAFNGAIDVADDGLRLEI
jgi:ribonuclease BN (tRNA processing enzyme)